MGLASHRTLPLIERGQGKPVVFLHGYPLNHEIWEPQLELLSDGHRVVLLDLPGYGLAREWPVPDTLAGFAEIVHRTLNQHFSSPVVVVGHSFGGYVALEMFRNNAGQFRGAVLTDTRSEPDTPEARENRLATVHRLEDPSQHLDVEATVRGLVAPRTWESGGPLLETLRRIVQDAPSPTIIASLKAIAGRADLTPVLPTLQVPALVLWGEEDTLIPPGQSRAMVARLRAGVGVGIPGAGHLPFLETPAAFARAVDSFLGRL